jgi:chloramphenicol O-acetyltransferase type A
MKEIIFNDPHRRKHFDFFHRMDQPHFNVCAPVDITVLLSHIRSSELPFTLTIVYCISRIANEIPEFRWRIREGSVWEHERVHPSFTVNTRASDVFSFCHVPFDPGFTTFLQNGRSRIEQMQHHPSFEDEDGREDLLFLSSFPWVAFTSVMHPMHYAPADSVPRIAWGKYHQEAGRTKMPLSVQAHHGLVDGRHVGHFFNQLQLLFDQPARIDKKN